VSESQFDFGVVHSCSHDEWKAQSIMRRL
jgi:hypothetical protein